jgi:hypothetical protein
LELKFTLKKYQYDYDRNINMFNRLTFYEYLLNTINFD